MVDVFKGMNDHQREAIAHLNGPLLVVAGAGSGKTRVITHRIAHIIQETDTKPDGVLAITFTNKAAGEMQERVEDLLGLKTPWITTFHSAGLRLMKLEQDLLPFENPFVILDADDQKRMFKLLLKQMEVSPDDVDPRYAASQVSTWKNQLYSPDDVEKMGHDNDQLVRVYRQYHTICRQECLADFDDLLLMTVRLLEEHEDVRKKYQERFPYILIDEYQDTNTAQYKMIRLLGAHQNVCATGDPDQGIYGWRGADIRNILDFQKDYPECKEVLLEQNYRSTKIILMAAQHVVENNKERKDKKIFTENATGKPITLVTVDDNYEEARAIAVRCQKLHEGSKQEPSRDWRDMAIFYRTNAQSLVIEEECIRRDIPYKIVGGLRFYDRKEIKDLLAYVKLIVNPRDVVSFERIVNRPGRKLGKKSIAVMRDYCLDEGVSLHELFMDDDLLDRVTVGRSAKAIREFAMLWRRLQRLPRDDAAQCVKMAIEMTEIDNWYRKQEPGEMGEARVENMYELISAAANQGSLDQFLDHVALFSSDDERERRRNDEQIDQVMLMTLHSSKGLEFPVVFITGCEQGLLPMVRQGRADYEEERRLMYVGITRAMEELYITRAVQRLQFGEAKCNPPSMFLAEIPDMCIEHKDATGRVQRYIGEVKLGPEYPEESIAAIDLDEPEEHDPRERRTIDRDNYLDDGGDPKTVLDRLNKSGTLTSGSALRAALRSGQSAQGAGKQVGVGGAKDDTPISLASDPFQPGDKIIHTALGRATVIKLTGPSESRRIHFKLDKNDRIIELILRIAAKQIRKA